MWQYLIPATCTLLVAIIEVLAQRERKVAQRDRSKIERIAEIRARESRLSMDMMAANSELCDVICVAVSGGHTNGNVEHARQKAKEARDAYDAFLRDIGADVVS